MYCRYHNAKYSTVQLHVGQAFKSVIRRFRSCFLKIKFQGDGVIKGAKRKQSLLSKKEREREEASYIPILKRKRMNPLFLKRNVFCIHSRHDVEKSPPLFLNFHTQKRGCYFSPKKCLKRPLEK